MDTIRHEDWNSEWDSDVSNEDWNNEWDSDISNEGWKNKSTSKAIMLNNLSTRKASIILSPKNLKTLAINMESRDMKESIEVKNEPFYPSSLELTKSLDKNEDDYKSKEEVTSFIENTSEEFLDNIYGLDIEEQLMRVIDLSNVSDATTNNQMGGKKTKDMIRKENNAYCYLYEVYLEQGKDKKQAKELVDTLRRNRQNRETTRWEWIKNKFGKIINTKTLLITSLVLFSLSFAKYEIKYWVQISNYVRKYFKDWSTYLISIYSDDVTRNPENVWFYEKVWNTTIDSAAWVVKAGGFWEYLSRLLLLPVYAIFQGAEYIDIGMSKLLITSFTYSTVLFYSSLGIGAISILLMYFPIVSEKINDKEFKDIDEYCSSIF